MQDCIRDLVKQSRSTRRYQEERRISRETLTELIDIARFCPSAGNRQPLRYVLSTDPDETVRIRSCLLWARDLPVWDGPGEGEMPPAYITMVTEQNSSPDPKIDIGIAAETILLAATERGMRGCMLGSILKDALRSILSLPERYEIHLVLAIGYPAESVVLEPLGDGGDTRYWRDGDGIHHVPKRSLESILINTRASEDHKLS